MVKIIGLDESGSFNFNDGEMNFIGGFTYEVDDFENEKAKLNKYFLDICEGYNEDMNLRRVNNHDMKNYQVKYPFSLHGSAIVFYDANANMRKITKNNRGKDNLYGRRVNNFKEYLTNKILSYLKKKSNFKIYTLLDTNESTGVKEIKSNLLDLSVGQNLYNSMALQAIFNQIYYVLEEKKQKYCLEIATRAPEGNDGDDLYFINTRTDDNGNVRQYIQSTVSETYRAGLNVFLKEKVKNGSRTESYKMDVLSANYWNDEEEKLTPFHYLADLVCGYIRDLFDDQKEQIDNRLVISVFKLENDKLKKIMEKQDNNIEIRTYGKCDEILCRMIESIDNSNLVDYFDELYDLKHISEEEDKCKGFYDQVWVEKTAEYLERKLKQDDYKQAFVGNILEDVARIEKYLRGKNEYEKGLFISLEYIGLIGKINRDFDDYERGKSRCKALFKLHDCAMSGYNHRGSIEKVKEHMDECEKYERYVSGEENIAHDIRTMSYYFNRIMIKELLEKIQPVQRRIDYMMRMDNELYPEAGENNKLAGKVYSSLGQAYGFLKQYDKSKENFEKALRCFDEDADFNITDSYYLHLLIENQDYRGYSARANRYFDGNGSLYKQMEAIFEKRREQLVVKDSYKLFVYVKAFNVFYAADNNNAYIIDSLLQRLFKIVNDQVVNLQYDDIHPWELIYKHLLEIMIKMEYCDFNLLLNGNADENDENVLICRYIKDKMFDGISNADKTIKMIELNSRFQMIYEYVPIIRNESIDQLNDDRKIIDDNDLQLFKEYFGDDIGSKTVEELKKLLDEKVTYTYH